MVESSESTDYSEVLETYHDADGLEIEINQLEGERDEVDDPIVKLEDRHEETGDELTDLQTRVDNIEKNIPGAFNQHIKSILAIFEYANIERIWTVCREKTVREGRRKVDWSAFDLHVVRSTDEDTSLRANAK